jgi:hypothetical protein
MKGKKIIFLIALFMFIPNVKASSCSVKASATSVTVGSSITISVTGSDAIGRFNLSSSSSVLKASSSSVWIENSTASVTFTAASVGTATVYVSPQAGLSNNNGDEINVGCNSVKITVKEKASSSTSSSSNSSSSSSSSSNKTSKSSNNYLKSYGIEGYTISPEFNKNTTDYTVTVPYDTKEIQINANKDSDKATLSGDEGKKEVTTGENKFTTTITAENGSKKNYNITVIVEEKPITVTVDGKEYTIVSKEEELPELKTEHEMTTLTIEDTEIPAYRIDSINYILVGLKTENGVVNLYKFDSYKGEEKPNEYTLYQEFSSSNIHLVLQENETIPSGYKKVFLTINDIEISAYQKEESDFYLVYGMNIETGDSSWYQYDKEENTFQRYIEVEDGISEQYLKGIFIIFSSIVSILMAIIIVLLKKKR